MEILTLIPVGPALGIAGGGSAVLLAHWLAKLRDRENRHEDWRATFRSDMAVAASFIPPVSARWDKSGLPLIPGAVNLIDAAVTKFSAHNRLRGIRVRRQMSALRDFAGTTLANSFSAHGIVHGGGALSVRDAKLAFFAHIDALLALSE